MVGYSVATPSLAQTLQDKSRDRLQVTQKVDQCQSLGTLFATSETGLTPRSPPD